MTTVQEPGATVIATSSAEAWPVKFVMSAQEASQTQWRWTGNGVLRTGGPQVTLSGRRRRSFMPSKPQEASFTTDQVQDVVQQGNRLACTVLLENGKREPLALEFETEAAAAGMAQSWPKILSAEVSEARAFAELLEKRGTRPYVTWTLMAACVAVFVLLALQGIPIASPQGPEMIRWGTNFGPLTLNGEPWRLFTAMFLHFGVLHLLFNTWALFSLGPTTEKVLGSARFAFLYVCAGLAGSLASLIWNPEVNSAGASGAVFGVMGAWLALVVSPETKIPPTVARRHRNAALGFIAYNVVFGLTHAGIDNAAHIGGLLMGFVLGWTLARPLGKPEEGPEGEGQQRDWVIASAVAAGALLISAIHLKLEATPTPVDAKVTAALQRFAELELQALQHAVTLQRRTEDGDISDRESALLAVEEVKPIWDEAVESVLDIDPGSRLEAQTRTALQGYVNLHLLQIDLHAESVVEDRADKREWLLTNNRKLQKAFWTTRGLLIAIQSRCEGALPKDSGRASGECRLLLGT